MMFTKSVRFQTPKDGGGSGNGTPAQGSVPEGTPAKGAADAGLEAQKKLQDELAKRDKDINQLKSTLQKQMSDQQRQWEQERTQLREDLRKAQMASMDDDEKKEFQKNLEQEDAVKWRQLAQQREQQLQEAQSVANYTQFFIDKGVPANKLVINQGLDALVNSGWQELETIMSDMRAKLKEYEDTHMSALPAGQDSNAQQQTSRTPIAATTTPAGSGTNWPDLIKTYGSAEEVYRMVEAGDLPPSIIPLT